MTAYAFFLLTVMLISNVMLPPAGERVFYVGTYTQGDSKGIYAYSIDATGQLTPLGLMAETRNPSFLVVHPNQRFLYSVNEEASGSITAFAIDRTTHKLTVINTVSSRGNSPCHLALDKTGKWLFVANYGDGSIAGYAINANGGLQEASSYFKHTGSGVNAQRQAGPHAHAVNISRDNRFLLVTDLGLDSIVVYNFDAKSGSLTPHQLPAAQVPPGSGARHLAFGANDAFAYVLNEMKASVSAFAYDKRRGTLKEIQTVPALPPDFAGSNSGAEIAVLPGGRFLYASNRGHDSLGIFSVNSATGQLKAESWVQTGKAPRNFAIDPTGRFVLAANQGSNSITVFKVERRTGSLTPLGTADNIAAPVCIAFASSR